MFVYNSMFYVKFYFSKNGIIGILLHAGDSGFTMDEHVYFEEKFKIMATDANIVKFSDHVVHAYINTERNGFEIFDIDKITCEWLCELRWFPTWVDYEIFEGGVYYLPIICL